MAAPATHTLDHIIHLTPPGSVDAAAAQFAALGFTVVPGGTHTGGLTANALIALPDGSYLELIAFTHPPAHYPPGTPARAARDAHYWAAVPPGWADYALLGTGDARVSAAINARADADGSGARYNAEVPGGRTRPDGREVQWVLSVPAARRTTLPFFCGDVTPRALRVPPVSAHANGAAGIAHVRVVVAPSDVASVTAQLTTVLGAPPTASSAAGARWALAAVTPGARAPELILSAPEDDAERAHAAGAGAGTPGIYEVGVYVGAGGGSGETTTPYGKIVWVPAV